MISDELLQHWRGRAERVEQEVGKAVIGQHANGIGGERGNTIRDTELLQNQIRRFRQLQSAAKRSCFIQGEPQPR